MAATRGGIGWLKMAVEIFRIASVSCKPLSFD